MSFPSAPVIDVRLIDQNQPRRHGRNPNDNHKRCHLVGTVRCAVRTSQRDVPTRIALGYAHPASVLTAEVKSIGYSNRAGLAHMKSPGHVCSLARAGLFLLTFLVALGLGATRAQNEPMLVPEAIDYQKLLPILPEPPTSWTADKPEGSTEDVGGFKITNVHRDYRKGEGEKAPSTAISILDSVANPDYVSATTEAWKSNSDTSEGYAKSVTIDGNPGFETFEKDTKHAALWVMVANRYFVQIELQNQDPGELQEWIKRIEVKKLAAIK